MIFCVHACEGRSHRNWCALLFRKINFIFAFRRCGVLGESMRKLKPSTLDLNPNLAKLSMLSSRQQVLYRRGRRHSWIIPERTIATHHRILKRSMSEICLRSIVSRRIHGETFRLSKAKPANEKILNKFSKSCRRESFSVNVWVSWQWHRRKYLAAEHPNRFELNSPIRSGPKSERL